MIPFTEECRREQVLGHGGLEVAEDTQVETSCMQRGQWSGAQRYVRSMNPLELQEGTA